MAKKKGKRMIPKVEVAGNPGTSNEPPDIADEAVTAEPANHDEIAALAYEFWTQRGSPIGSPEEDWFRAEAELKNSGMKARAATA